MFKRIEVAFKDQNVNIVMSGIESLFKFEFPLDELDIADELKNDVKFSSDAISDGVELNLIGKAITDINKEHSDSADRKFKVFERILKENFNVMSIEKVNFYGINKHVISYMAKIKI